MPLFLSIRENLEEREHERLHPALPFPTAAVVVPVLF